MYFLIMTEAQTTGLIEGPLRLDSSRRSLRTGAFYWEESEAGLRSWIVRKAGEKVWYDQLFFNSGNEHFRRETVEIVLTESQLRREFIKLSLYRELGLAVPQAKLITVNDQLALAVEYLGYVRPLNQKTESLSSEQAAEVQRFYFASHFLDNPRFVYSLAQRSDNSLVLVDCLPWGSQGIFFFYPGNRRATQRTYTEDLFEKYFGLNVDRDDPLFCDMLERLQGLKKKKIVDIVLASGLPFSEARETLAHLLAAQERTERYFTAVNLEAVMKNSPEWDTLDGYLEKSQGNAEFASLSRQLNYFCERYREIQERMNLLKAVEIDSQEALPMDEAFVKTILVTGDPFRASLLEGINNVLAVKKQLMHAKKRLPGLIYKLRGYPAYELALESRVVEAERRRRGYLNESCAYFCKSGYKVLLPRDSLHNLDNYLAPTLQQLLDWQEFLAIVEREEGIDRESRGSLRSIFEELKRRRADFKALCEDRSRSVVVHVSTPRWIKNAMVEGFLESGLSQASRGKRRVANSPAGAREPLPALAFSIGGAAEGYGGEDRQIIERTGWGGDRFYDYVRSLMIESGTSCGFVAGYVQVVTGRQFMELPMTGGGGYEELHVFCGDYVEEKRKGVELEVKGLVLLVPESEKTKWEEFLAGYYDQFWINDHLKTYPPYLDMNTYVRYFSDELGIETSPLGIFLTDFKKAVPDKTIGSRNIYRWVSS